MDKGIFYNCSIFNSSNLVFESEDPHIFEDPDPRSQNVADPTVPDPKYWLGLKKWKGRVLLLN